MAFDNVNFEFIHKTYDTVQFLMGVIVVLQTMVTLKKLLTLTGPQVQSNPAQKKLSFAWKCCLLQSGQMKI
jgi:hypothetical protein